MVAERSCHQNSGTSSQTGLPKGIYRLRIHHWRKLIEEEFPLPTRGGQLELRKKPEGLATLTVSWFWSGKFELLEVKCK